MKKLNEYMQEVEQDLPQVGDVFIFESEEGELVESHVVGVQEDGIVVASDQQAEALLSLDGYLLEAIARYGAVGNSRGMGHTQNEQDMGPGDHLNAIENGELGDNDTLAEEEPVPPNADHNDPLLSKSIDDAAVPAMESDDLIERLLQLANVAEAGSWIGKDTDKPAHLRKAEYEKSQAPDSPAKKFRVPGDPSTPAAQRKIQPGDAAPGKKPTTEEEHELSELHRRAGIIKADEGLEMSDLGQEVIKMMNPRDQQRFRPDQIDRAVDVVVDQLGHNIDPRDRNKVAEIASKVIEMLNATSSRTIHEGEPNAAESPVAQAIVGRIVRAHTDLLAKYGPEKVGDAVDRVARSVGDVDEIGTSDVSGWVRRVKQELQTSESLEEIRRRSGLGPRRGHALDDYEKMRRQRDQYWNQSSPPSDSEFKNRDEEDDPNYRRQQKDKFKDLDEAEYHGRDVPLGKPMQGDVKKFKVYVKDPKTGNVKKVNFGDKTMRIKKSNPKRRKSFRARHHCDNPGPRTKARYWSCRKW